MTDDHAGEFQALLDGWAAAIVANDPDRIAGFTEPDWVIVTPEGGPAALDLFLGFVASGDLTHSAMTFELVDARVFDGVAVVVAHGTNEGMFRAIRSRPTSGSPRFSYAGPTGGAARGRR